MIPHSVQRQSKWDLVDTFGEDLHVNSIVVQQGTLFVGSDGMLSAWNVTDLTKIEKITATVLNGIVTSVRLTGQKILALIVTPDNPSRNQLIRFDAKTLLQEAVIADGVLDYTLNGDIVFCVKGDSTIYNYNKNTGIQISACNIKASHLNKIVYSKDPIRAREDLLCVTSSNPDSLVFVSGNEGLQRSIHPLTTSLTNLATTQDGCIITYGTTPDHTPLFQVWDPTNTRKEIKIDLKDSPNLIPLAFSITVESIFMALKSEEMEQKPGIKVFKNNAALEESAFLSRGEIQPRTLACSGDDLLFAGVFDPNTGAGGIDIWTKRSQRRSVLHPDNFKWKKTMSVQINEDISFMIPAADKLFTASKSKLTRWDFTEQNWTGHQEATVNFPNEIKNLTYFKGYLYAIIPVSEEPYSKMVKIDPHSLEVVKSRGLPPSIQFYSIDDMLFAYGNQNVRRMDPETLNMLFLLTTVDPITSIKMVGNTLLVAGDSHMAAYDPITGAVKNVIETTFTNPQLGGQLGKRHIFVTEWLALHHENIGIYDIDSNRAITAQTILKGEFGSTSAAIFKDQIIFATREGVKTFSNDINFKEISVLSRKGIQPHIEKLNEMTFLSSHKVSGFRTTGTTLRIWKRAFNLQS